MRNFTIILFLLSCITLFSQNDNDDSNPNSQNVVGLSAFGDGSIMSLYLERIQYIHNHVFFTFKSGAGMNQEFLVLSGGDPPEVYLTAPLHITANFGNKNHFFEIGMGYTKIFGDTTIPTYYYPIIGYRFFPFKDKKTNVRIYGQIPIGIHSENESPFTKSILFLPFGVSIGSNLSQ